MRTLALLIGACLILPAHSEVRAFPVATTPPKREEPGVRVPMTPTYGCPLGPDPAPAISELRPRIRRMLRRCRVGGSALSASIFIDVDGHLRLLDVRLDGPQVEGAPPLDPRVRACVERNLTRWTVSPRAVAALGPWPPSWIRLVLVPEAPLRVPRPRAASPGSRRAAP